MVRKIDPKEMPGDVFSRIGSQWMLITAGTADHCNTMTASWGGLGVLWNKKVATCYIRPQRYTYEFMERSEFFTLSFLDEAHRDAHKICGAKSGRDMDKIAACGLTVRTDETLAPYFEEAELVLVCRKLYRQDLREECFVDESLIGACYPQRDFHRMYVGEITSCLVRE